MKYKKKYLQNKKNKNSQNKPEDESGYLENLRKFKKNRYICTFENQSKL